LRGRGERGAGKACRATNEAPTIDPAHNAPSLPAQRTAGSP
jgi:hypothetical protein